MPSMVNRDYQAIPNCDDEPELGFHDGFNLRGSMTSSSPMRKVAYFFAIIASICVVAVLATLKGANGVVARSQGTAFVISSELRPVTAVPSGIPTPLYSKNPSTKKTSKANKFPTSSKEAELEDPISNMEPSSGHEESQKPDASRPPHPSRKPATGRPTEERRHSSNPAKRSKGPNPPLPNDPAIVASTPSKVGTSKPSIKKTPANMPKIEPTLSKPIIYHKEPESSIDGLVPISKPPTSRPSKRTKKTRKPTIMKTSRPSKAKTTRPTNMPKIEPTLSKPILYHKEPESESKIPFVADQSDPESVPKPESNESEGEAEGGGAEAEGAEAEGGAKAESN